MSCKKLFLAVGIALLMLVCGCQKAQGGEKKLTLWMPPFGTEDTLDKDLWQNILKPFAEKNGVKLEIEIVPWSNYEEKYLTAVSSGSGPDVGYMYNELIADYISLGAISPFDELISEVDRANYLYLDEGKVDGKQYGLPFIVGNARIVVFNKNLLAKEGVAVPKTWDEFLAAVKKLTKPGQYGAIMAFGGGHYGIMNASFTGFLWQAGGEYFSPDGKQVAINTPAGYEALEFLNNLKPYMPPSILSIADDELIDAFKKGNIGFMFASTGVASRLKDAAFEWDFIPALENKESYTFVAVDQLVLMSAAKDKELAYKLMSEMLSKESLDSFHKMSPFPPVTREETYADDPRYKDLYTNYTDNFRSLQKVKGSVPVLNALYKNIQSMLLGEKTIQQVLTETTEYGNLILKQ